MLTKNQKIKLVEELAEILRKNPSLLFVDFSGLTMGELGSLKKELKKDGIKFKALKKSLLGFAFQKSGREEFSAQGESASGGDFGLADHKGSVAIVYGENASYSAEASQDKSDAAMAKIVHKFSAQTKKLAILGGFLMGEKMLKNAVVALAQLPAREALLAQVVQLLMSPVSGFARALSQIKK